MYRHSPYSPNRPDTISLAAIALVLIVAAALLGEAPERATPAARPGAGTASLGGQAPAAPLGLALPAVVAPYEEFWVTQGPHGERYGHLAIDLAGGKGSTIRSPISGVVTAAYVDPYGNTTLVLENDIYRIMLLHGDYSVTVGEQVALGQAVGTESNHGYTTDINGVPCADRDCGYHTHLNVFDKRVGSNVNPLVVLGLDQLSRDEPVHAPLP